jgi:GNAT superfamily N-acetyltransferase
VTQQESISNLDIARRMERNYINGFRLISGINGTIFSEDEDTAEFWSGYSTAWINGVFRTNGSAQNLDEIVARTLRKNPAVPMLWRVGVLTSEATKVGEKLIANGLRDAGTVPALALMPGQLVSASKPSELAVKTVSTPHEVIDWLEPYCTGFDLSDTIRDHFEQFIKGRLGLSQSEAWFVGYVDNKPACCAYYLTTSEITVIYNVATLAEFRNHGYGRSLVEAAIQHAWLNSAYPIALYSSEMGLSVYRKIGFTDVYRLGEFVRD